MMKIFRILFLSILAGLILAATAVCQQTSEKVSLQITEQNGKYVLTVPVSHLVMTIQKGGLAKTKNPFGGAGDSPRYFMLQDSSLHLIVSGWFESDEHFDGIKKLWATDVAAWKQRNLPEAKDVSFEDVGKWQTIFYDTTSPAKGQSHIRAEWVQDGTWIDLHLSFTSDDKSQTERRDRLRKELKAIQVDKKP